MKRFLTWVLALTVIFTTSYCMVPAFAVSNNLFAVSDISQSTVGSTFQITISMANPQQNVGGIRLAVQYDTTKLKYTLGSRVIGNSGMESNATPDTERNGKISFVWESETGVNCSGILLTYQFEVLSPILSSDTPISFYAYEVYRADVGNTDILPAGNTLTLVPTVTAVAIDGQVQQVIGLINGIGTVTFTNESKAKIDAAFAAYDSLKYVQKVQVTNYDVLTASYNTYNALKNQQAQSANEVAAAEFRRVHSYALGLSITTIQLKAKSAVETAIAEWDKLKSIELQGLLITDKNHLRVLQQRLVELQKIADNELSQAELLAQAKIIVADYKNSYKFVLGLTVDKVTIDDDSAVSTAYSDIDNYAFVNSLVPGMLSDCKVLLLALKEKIKELRLKEDAGVAPAITEAEEFNRKFGWLLSTGVDMISADDETDIKVAIAFYEMLSKDAQNLLPSASEKLNKLLQQAQSLVSDSPAVTTPDTTTSTQTDFEVEPVPVDNTTDDGASEELSQKVLVRNIYNTTSPVVWWCVIVFASSLLALSASSITYFVFKNKKSKFNGSNEVA